MSINYRIAQIADVPQVYQFAEDKLRLEIPDDMELMMAVWNSRFRKEALEHYLKMGWSFIAYDENEKIHGFFLGQPFLFFQGHTQTLWVEMITAADFKIEAELAEIAIKLSRDKHLQKVVLPKSVETLHFENSVFKFQKWSDECVWVKTTK